MPRSLSPRHLSFLITVLLLAACGSEVVNRRTKATIGALDAARGEDGSGTGPGRTSAELPGSESAETTPGGDEPSASEDPEAEAPKLSALGWDGQTLIGSRSLAIIATE